MTSAGSHLVLISKGLSLLVHSHANLCLDLSDQLALVGSIKQLQPRLWNVLKFCWHNRLCFVNLELAICEGLLEDLHRLGEVFQEIQDDEALALQAHDDHLEKVLKPRGPLRCGIVRADGTTGDDSSLTGHAAQHQVQDLSGHIVEVDWSSLASC